MNINFTKLLHYRVGREHVIMLAQYRFTPVTSAYTTNVLPGLNPYMIESIHMTEVYIDGDYIDYINLTDKNKWTFNMQIKSVDNHLMAIMHVIAMH